MSKASAITRSVSAAASARNPDDMVSNVGGQNYAAQPVTSIVRPCANPVRAFKSVLALDSIELKTYLDAATSNELRALRAHIGFGCAGTKDMNKGLIWDHVGKQRRGASLTKSPEGRGGRERAIRPGAAAAALRVEAAKTARLTDSDLEDDSFADFSKPMPAFPGQMFAHEKPDPMQTYDPWKTPPRSRVTARHTGWTPELEMRKNQMNELLSRHHQVAAPLPDVPEITPTTPSDVGFALVLSKLTELTVGVNDLRAAQATAVTRQDLQEFHVKSSLEFKAFVASRTEPLRDDLSLVMQTQETEKERTDNLQTELSELKKRFAALNVRPSASSRGFRTDDTDARKCIAFKGFAPEESAAIRCGILEAFMALHFAGVKYACISHETSGPVQKRQLADTSYVVFFETFSADSVLARIQEDKAKYTCVSSRRMSLKISKRKTKLEKLRNYSLFRAGELLEESVGSETPTPDVKIVWQSRKVTVNDVDAFVQSKDDERGSFCGVFANIVFIDRQR